jgi:hypothetical protein
MDLPGHLASPLADQPGDHPKEVRERVTDQLPHVASVTSRPNLVVTVIAVAGAVLVGRITGVDRPGAQ